MSEMFITPSSQIEFSDLKMKKVNLFESPNMFCDLYCLRPGQKQSEHSHAQNDKIYYALKGACQVRIGDQVKEIQEGQMAVAPAGIIHGVTNHTEKDAALMVIMAPHPNFDSTTN